MVNFNLFKKTISLLEKHKISFWVFGGFALDGLRGKITREHGDIDIYVKENDISKLETLFPPEKYIFYKKEKMYYIKSQELKIGIVPLSKEGDTVTAHGNKTLARYPKEMFSMSIYGAINSFKFKIVPREVLFLESQYSRFESDKSFGQNIQIDKKLFNKIRTTKIRD